MAAKGNSQEICNFLRVIKVNWLLNVVTIMKSKCSVSSVQFPSCILQVPLTHVSTFQMQKRAPALLDNLVQAFLMAPYFVLLEVPSLIKYTSALSF